MPEKKLTDDVVRGIVSDRKSRMSKKDIMDKYDISRATYQVAMRKAIACKYISKDERDSINKELYQSGWKKAFGNYIPREKHRNLFSFMWHVGMGKNPDLIRKAASSGGKATQEKAPHVIENLQHSVPYGQSDGCYYEINDHIFSFGSKGERFVALMLVKLGWLDQLKEGENFQVTYGKIKVDFLKDGVAVEYHPVPKNHITHQHEDESHYKEEREKQFKAHGIEAKLIVINSIPNLLRKLPEIGISIKPQEYYRYRREVLQDIKENEKASEEKRTIQIKVQSSGNLEDKLDEDPIPF